MQDLSWREFKERYLRPNYLQYSFIFGALTLGLRVSSANYTFSNSVSPSIIRPTTCWGIEGGGSCTQIDWGVSGSWSSRTAGSYSACVGLRYMQHTCLRTLGLSL